MDARSRLLFDAFLAAVDAARAENWLPPTLAELEPPPGQTCVLAVGKGADEAARVFAARWPRPFTGLAIAPGAAEPAAGFERLEAGHPVPDARSLAAGRAALAFAGEAGPDDLLLVLVSGGASSLMCAPTAGLDLPTKAALTTVLLRSGASIGELNAVRRALSQVKGGGLLRATGAGRVTTLAVSDVPGDAIADIGSGPAVPSPTGAAEALAVLRRRAPQLWVAIQPLLRDPPAPKAGAEVRARVVFRPADALAAAARVLETAGVAVDLLGADLGGEAREVGARHAGLLSVGGPRALLSGGELDVSLPADRAFGRGGRNQEYLLALAAALAGRTDVRALAADTDGRDGSEPVAGAWIDPAFLLELTREEADAALTRHDSYGLFAAHGRALVTGPTGVNVGDFRLVLVDPVARGERAP